jgi:sec-independent protein translocase protein TatA
MPLGISWWEILLLLLVLLLVFGPKRLPEAGKSLGKGIREFKDSLSGHDDEPREGLPPPPPAAAAATDETEPVAATTKKPTA